MTISFGSQSGRVCCGLIMLKSGMKPPPNPPTHKAIVREEQGKLLKKYPSGKLLKIRGALRRSVTCLVERRQ